MLNNPIETCTAIILAAGEGKRMKSPLPKVMHEVHGKPIIGHIVSALEGVKEVNKIVVVVSPKHTLVQEYLGERAEYIVQHEQKGTGHATLVTEPFVKENTSCILVIYGDLPCLRTASLEHLVREHVTHANHITMMTTTVSKYAGFESPFLTYGRIIRDEKANIKEIVEYKDATDEQKNIREVNSGLYCFESPWVFDQLKKLQPNNAQNEYYLTDVVKMALDQGEKVLSVSLDPTEAVGVTTQEDIQMIENFNA